MRSLFDAMASSVYSATWLTIILEAAWKGAMLLATAFLLSLLLRRAAAATRHLLWSLALIGLLVLPVLSFIIPAWRVSGMPQVLPTAESFEKTPLPAPEMRLPKSKSLQIYQARGENTLTVSNNYASRFSPTSENAPKSNWLAALPAWTWSTWIFVAWFAGVTLVAARWLCGSFCLKLLSRRSQEIRDDAWYDLSERLSAELGLQQPVTLRRAHDATAPMTWGFLHPVILLPNDADTWTAERRRVVLLHELAHVKRGDWVSQGLAQLACALHWFNPLTWIAARRLRVEREQACDDAVLNSGTKASDYANHILEILRALRFKKYSPSAAMAMAPCSQIESRMRAILNPRLRRRALTPAGEMLLGAGIACLVLPLAALNPDPRPESAPMLMTGKFILPNTPLSAFDLKANWGAGKVDGRMVIPPWNVVTEETASTAASGDCAEEKTLYGNKPIKLDEWVENSVNGVGQNLVAAIHSLGIANLPAERLVGETAEKVGKALAGKLRAAGYDDVSIHKLVGRVNEGVGAGYVQEVKHAGYPNLSVEQLLQMRIYGVDADYINAMKEAGFDHLSVEELIQLRIHGVDGDYAREMKNAYGDLGLEELLQLRIQGVDADYAKEMKAAGYDNLSIEELLQLRIQGVDADYAKEMKATFGELSLNELLQLRIQGVDADYAKEMKAAGFGDLGIEELLQLRIQGVDADYAKEMKAAYGELSLNELLQLRIQGVDADYAREMKTAGYDDLSIEELLQLRIQGVDADYAKEMKTTFGELSINELLQLRIQGVDADYAKEMKAAGFGELGIDELLQLRIQGVDADYAKEMKAAGFTDLSTNDLLQLRIQGVDADYVKDLKAVGYNNLRLEQVLQMRIQGVDADFVKELQDAGLKNLTPEKLIQMKIHGLDAKFFKE